MRKMPQMRRNSTGQVEGDHLEGITERTEYEEEQQTVDKIRRSMAKIRSRQRATGSRHGHQHQWVPETHNQGTWDTVNLSAILITLSTIGNVLFNQRGF